MYYYTKFEQFDRGIFALMGTVDPESFDTLHSYANAFEMPFVTPWFPESAYQSSKDSKQNFAIQIRPEYHEGLIDVITYYEWTKIIYIYRYIKYLRQLNLAGRAGIGKMLIRLVRVRLMLFRLWWFTKCCFAY